MKIIPGSITSPAGYRASGMACGIKKSGKPDLALIYSEISAVCAGVFTKNSIKAAPLIVSMEHLRNNSAQAIIINSGNANCFTGKFGLLYARQSTEIISRLLDIRKSDVLVTSTGIIGKTLPFYKIKASAPALIARLSRNGANKAAKAILTTDLKTKKIAIGGIAKGSGMIAPNMATMLGFLTTDAAISPKMLKLALRRANDKSFNCITVDGCMSTNDMVILMANGLAGNRPIVKSG